MDDRLTSLRAHAEALQGRMAGAEGAAFAALSARYMDALKQIDEIERRSPAGKSAVDEIAARRQRRKPVRDGVAREGGAG